MLTYLAIMTNIGKKRAIRYIGHRMHISKHNSVANNAIPLRFGTVIAIPIPNIFHYMTSIEMLTYLAIKTNIGKNCLHLVALKSNNSVEN